MFNADTANVADAADIVLLTFGAIGMGLLVFTLWMGLRYFFGWGYSGDNYQSDQVRPNRRLTGLERLGHMLRRA